MPDDVSSSKINLSSTSRIVDRSARVPFFSKLGVKHGIILTALVLMAMTIISAEQLRKELAEIEKSAVEKGKAVATTLGPMVLPAVRNKDLETLKLQFNNIIESGVIDYIEIVTSRGRVVVQSDLGPGHRRSKPLNPSWLDMYAQRPALDRKAIAVQWPAGTGVDIFVVLHDNPGSAPLDEILNAKHLRVGINLDTLIQRDTPRVIWEMAVFTLIVASVMVLGLVILLTYILRPLRELHRGFVAVASGDLEYQVPVYSRDEVGRVIQAFNATTSRLRSAFEQIEALATRDPLTNLANRRTFDERLAIEAARSRRFGHGFGLLIVDLDKFKEINDSFGHAAGDEILRFVSKTIEANVRETDLPARIGGDEFAVILPESGNEAVKSVAEKLRAAVSECDLHSKHGLPPNFRTTVSIGAACSAGHLITPESIMAAADAALYRSKGEGRNRTTIAPMRAGKTDIMRATKKEDDRTE